MMRSLRLVIVIALFSASTVRAQHEATMHFMTSLPQVSYNNPAFQPSYKFSIGLPGSSVYVQYANNGFAYNDFASTQGDSVVANLDDLYSVLKKKNFITTAAQADLFRISLKANARLYLTMNITAKSYNRLMLPKDFIGIFVNGTAPLIDQTVTISPQFEALSYIESALGASYIVNRKLTIGARIKMLSGIANATTVGSLATLTVNNDYSLTAQADVKLKTSGIHQLEDDDEFDIGDDWEVYKDNSGFAFDVGGTYKLMDDQLTVGLSLIDIGGITWKNDTYGYELDPAKANYTFQGINLETVLNGDEDENYLEAEGDSIADNFKMVEGTIAKYRTPLPAKVYLSASYALRKTVTVNALFFAEKFRDRFSPGFAASFHKEFGRRLNTSISYTITNNSFNNVGAGLSLNLAPLQVYLVGDNLLRAPLALATDNELNPFLNSSKFFNLRVGVNLVFGWVKSQEQLPYPAKD